MPSEVLVLLWVKGDVLEPQDWNETVTVLREDPTAAPALYQSIPVVHPLYNPHPCLEGRLEGADCRVLLLIRLGNLRDEVLAVEDEPKVVVHEDTGVPQPPRQLRWASGTGR